MNKINLMDFLNPNSKDHVSTLFGADVDTKSEYQKKLKKFLTSPDIYEKVVNKLTDEQKKKPTMQILAKFVEIAEEVNLFTTVEDQMNFLIFTGYNVAHILRATKIIINRQKSEEFKSDIFEDMDDDDDDDDTDEDRLKSSNLPDFVKKIVEALSGSVGGLNTSKSEYEYKIEGSRLLLKDLYEEKKKSNPGLKTLTNNLENVLNEIISKETFEVINKLRIFYTDSEGKLGEAVPQYEDNKCKNVNINSFE